MATIYQQIVELFLSPLIRLSFIVLRCSTRHHPTAPGPHEPSACGRPYRPRLGYRFLAFWPRSRHSVACRMPRGLRCRRLRAAAAPCCSSFTAAPVRAALCRGSEPAPCLDNTRLKNLPFCQFLASAKSRKKAIFTPSLIRSNSRPSSYQILPNFLPNSNPILPW